MSRKKNCDREFSELQRLKQENKKLKRTISSLRKQIARIDLDRYENLKDLIEDSDNSIENKIAEEREKVKKKWECFECKEGILKLMLINVGEKQKYFRKCTLCNNRTKTKVFTKDTDKGYE